MFEDCKYSLFRARNPFRALRALLVAAFCLFGSMLSAAAQDNLPIPASNIELENVFTDSFYQLDVEHKLEVLDRYEAGFDETTPAETRYKFILMRINGLIEAGRFIEGANLADEAILNFEQFNLSYENQLHLLSTFISTYNFSGQFDNVFIIEILVAEDDAENTAAMKSILANPRIELTFVNNGEKVVETFNGGTFDLIFMNVSMPLMDSLTVTKLIRLREKQHRLNSTPIIGVSAHLLEDQRQKFSAVGMNDFLEAPLEKDKLIAVMQRQLRAKRAAA